VIFAISVANLELDATVDIAIWSTIEQGLAITAGSLATLRPLFKLLSRKLGFSSTTDGPAASERGYGAATVQTGVRAGIQSRDTNDTPIDLAGMLRKEDPSRLREDNRANGRPVSQYRPSTRDRRPHVWTAPVGRGNESEEELKSSGSTLEEV
jgi:hypothetical protein